MSLAWLHCARSHGEGGSKLQASNWTPGFTERHMLNLAYIRREFRPVVKAVLPCLFFPLNFLMWEMTPSSGYEIPGGIPAGGREGVSICLLKEDRLPLLPTEQQLFRDLQVEGRGSLKSTMLLKSDPLPKACGCLLLGSAKFLERCEPSVPQ